MNNPDIRFYPDGYLKVGDKILRPQEPTVVYGISAEAMAINVLALHIKELYETIAQLETKLRTINTRFGA